MKMKNGDLVVKGQRVDELDLSKFKTAEEMTRWELISPNVYWAMDERYGKNGFIASQADNLEDIFGSEWADRFYGRKHQLHAQAIIKKIEDERDRYIQMIIDLKQVIAMPTNSAWENNLMQHLPQFIYMDDN